MTLQHAGNLNLSSSLLMEKARKAFFKIKKAISLDNSCKLLEKLFDTLVVPIALYGSEVWGIGKEFKNSDPYEHLHIKFIKEALGVHCKASNAACLSELNRLPLYTNIQFLAIKYWLHIMESENSLCYKVCIATETNNSWIKNMKNLINKLGFNYLRENPFGIKLQLNQIKERINDTALQKLESEIKQNSKLTFFSKLYKPNSRPPYVDHCKLRKDRSVLCKIRVSAHSLYVEKGRYLNIPLEDRLCRCCNSSEIEDELHFLLSCPAYDQARINFIHKINNSLLNQKINRTTNISCHLIYSIFNNESTVILKILANHINECLLLRSSTLS